MDIFDVIGPIMIGPSSSHTAGAARIGFVAREILGEEVRKARIQLHGSFADTYVGHGTDRAMIAGLMGMRVDDVRLRDSLKIAREAGMDFAFSTVELEGAHPNTAIIRAQGTGGNTVSVQASSVGGGAIRVDKIDDMAVSFKVRQDTIVIRHKDTPGVIAAVSGCIARHGMNIATMQVFRTCEGGQAIMAIEVDALVPPELKAELMGESSVEMVACMRKF